MLWNRLALCSIVLLLSVACAQEEPEVVVDETAEAEVEVVEVDDVDATWSYAGDEGPDAWGSLSSEWESCATGGNQSPIDLVASAATQADLPELSFDYSPFPATAAFDGNTVQVEAPAGNTLTIGEDVYQLVQFHFHAGSEHTVDGRQLPLELHLVHANDANELAVVGVLIEEGEAANGFGDLWNALPTEATAGSSGAEAEIDVASLLPSATTSWRYDGSLTTPPCSEGVRWIVMTEPVELSVEQIAKAAALLADSFRPVQPLGERTVQTDLG